MTIDWLHFTPWSALAGGALIGLAASLFVIFNGRIAGISGLLVLPVAFEIVCCCGVDQFADGLIGVEQKTILIEYGSRALLAGIRVHDQRACRGCFSQCASGHVRGAHDERAAFGGSVGVHHRTAETSTEAFDIDIGGFVAHRNFQRVDGVVGLFRSGEDVGERLSDVIEKAGPMAPDVR